MTHIFGMTLCNEGSVRDWLHHGKFNVTQGKNFDRSGSIGPWIVTSDECDPRGPHDIITRVNGEVRQNDSTERLMFPFDFLIAYLSTFATLKPGDMIATGTPTGAGARFDAAALAQAGRRRRGRIQPDRRAAQHRGGGAIADARSTDGRTAGAAPR